MRRRRMAVSFCVGTGIVVGAVVLLVKSSTGIAAQSEEEEAVQVELAKAPEPEPEPEPEPPPPSDKPKPSPRPKLSTPTSLSDEKPAEAEVKKEVLNADPDEKEAPQEPVKTVVEAPPPPPPPPKPVAPPKPKGPVRVTEGMTSPVALGANTNPEFPPAVKSAGIEGVVIVKFTVSESGMVTDAKVLKGPPELHAVCLNAVKSWRFKPALSEEGKPVAVVQIKRFAFRIRT